MEMTNKTETLRIALQAHYPAQNKAPTLDLDS